MLLIPLQLEVYYYTRDTCVAEDVVGDIFLMLLEADPDQREVWKSKEDAMAFLKVVAKFKSIDWLRKQSNHHRIHSLIDWPVLENPQLSDEQLKTYAMSLLKAKERSLLTQIIEGKSVKEFSQENKISEKTVRNNLSLIRLKLSKLKILIHFFWG
jgi:DNA-directed RNA polymerase specialized sigma24 family protein